MFWFALLPMALLLLPAVAEIVVTTLLERGERRRRQRAAERRLARRRGFRPVLIQGGKAQAPPADAALPGETAGGRSRSA